MIPKPQSVGEQVQHTQSAEQPLQLDQRFIQLVLGVVRSDEFAKTLLHTQFKQVKQTNQNETKVDMLQRLSQKKYLEKEVRIIYDIIQLPEAQPKQPSSIFIEKQVEF